jgi:hypothetical protein
MIMCLCPVAKGCIANARLSGTEKTLMQKKADSISIVKEVLNEKTNEVIVTVIKATFIQKRLL